jgi:hypothetical protein
MSPVLYAIRSGLPVYDATHGPELHTGKPWPRNIQRVNPRTIRALLKRGLIKVEIETEYGVSRRRFREIRAEGIDK